MTRDRAQRPHVGAGASSRPPEPGCTHASNPRGSTPRSAGYGHAPTCSMSKKPRGRGAWQSLSSDGAESGRRSLCKAPIRIERQEHVSTSNVEPPVGGYGQRSDLDRGRIERQPVGPARLELPLAHLSYVDAFMPDRPSSASEMAPEIEQFPDRATVVTEYFERHQHRTSA